MSFSLRSLIPCGFLLILVLAIPVVASAETIHAVTPSPALLAFSLPSSTAGAPAAMPVANWTFSGCWSPRTGAPCVDVFRDGNGQAWACKACGQTGNPSPGKCKKVSDAELANGRWCS